MGLFKPASNQTAFLKLGILGFEGSGKTRTAFEIMGGLCNMTNKNILGFFDSEKGSDFFVDTAGQLRPEYKKRFPKLTIQVIKSRSFTDLLAAVREAQAGGFGALIIDSTTHVWKELIDAWLRKKGRTYLEISDWGKLKAEWSQFVDLYINSSLHIAMLGRAGYTYDDLEDEEGKSKMVKSGIKMKVESETGFEPDLLLEMFKEAGKINVGKGARKLLKGQGFVNKCLVLKDRTGQLNGQTFEFPGFKTFEPVICRLALGKEHVGVDTSRTSDEMFADEGTGDRSYYEMKRLHEICQEEIKQEFVLNNLAGTAKEVEKERVQLMIDVFGTSSWTAITSLKLHEIQAGLGRLREAIKARNAKALAAPPVVPAQG